MLKHKPLKEYTNAELIFVLDYNESIDLKEMAGYLSEILRRINKKEPLLEE